MEIHQVPADHPDAVRLIEEVQSFYVSIYGSRDETPVDATEFAAPNGAFLLGFVGEEPVAIGAWRSRRLDSAPVAEIKRMYVVPAHQRRGLARQLLAALEESARAAGREQMVLETGAPQGAAIALYEQAGYEPIPGFGHYRDAPESRYYARPLKPDAGRDGTSVCGERGRV